MEGAMTLEIKDDATYRLIETLGGRGDVAGKKTNDSGVVVANGRTITLKSSSGQWIPLTRNGNALYGLVQHRSGRTGRLRSARRAPAAVVKPAKCSNRGGGAVGAPAAASGGPIVWGRAPAGAGSVIPGVRERDWRLP
jgi:hypothetical protein